MVRAIVAFFVIASLCHAQEQRFVFHDGTKMPISQNKTTQVELLVEELPLVQLGDGPLSVALNQAGTYLATGSADGAVKLWALENSGFKPTLEIRNTKDSTEPAHPKEPVKVDLHPKAPDAGVVASIGTYDSKLGRIFWIFPDGKQKFNGDTPAAEMRTLVGEPVGFAFSPDAQFEAQFDSLRVFVTRKLNRAGHTPEEREQKRQVWSKDVTAKAITWTGDTLAILTEKEIIGWKPEVEATKPRYLFPANKARAIAGSPSFLVMLGQKTMIYDLQRQLRAEIEYSAILACLSPDEKLLFTLSKNGEITIWDMKSGVAVKKQQLEKAVTSIDCGYEDGKYIFVAGSENGELHSFRVSIK